MLSAQLPKMVSPSWSFLFDEIDAQIYEGKRRPMNIAYPLSITDEGLVATTGYSQHIEQLIEQVLFTMPGERVNLPDFGTGITQLIFSPGNAEMVSATQFLIQGALQQWLGNLIQVQAVQVVAEDSTLNVTIQYIVKQTKQPRVASFTR